MFRRSALEEVGGFPLGSLTEDFDLGTHARGRPTVYGIVPDPSPAVLNNAAFALHAAVLLTGASPALVRPVSSRPPCAPPHGVSPDRAVAAAPAAR